MYKNIVYSIYFGDDAIGQFPVFQNEVANLLSSWEH